MNPERFALAFFTACLALACSKSSDGESQCDDGCAGAAATVGAPFSGSGGALAAGGAPSNDAGGPQSANGGADNGHFVVATQECIDLADCCAAPDGGIANDCFNVIVQDMPEACTQLLMNYQKTAQCFNTSGTGGAGASSSGGGGSGGGSGASGGAAGSGAVSGVAKFGKGFATAACTSNNTCLAVIKAFGSGSSCDGVASVSCSFEGVTGCCIYANAETCYYGDTSAAQFQHAQDCQSLGSWSPTP